MNFKKYLNEKYSIKPVEDASQFDTVLSILNKTRNDFIFLHVNSFGLSFKTAHDLFSDYYHQLSYDIDYVLEIVGMCSDDTIINLNTFNTTCISDEFLNTESNLFRGANQVLENVLTALDMLREILVKLNNDALVSRVDSMAEYYVKQNNYIIKQFNK